MIKMHALLKLAGSFRSKKRLGRGIGSGKGGHTAGRGTKGQKARKGSHKPWLGFEGGQVPLYKRLPRMGKFKKQIRMPIIAVSLTLLDHFKASQVVTPVMLWKEKLIKRFPRSGVKILANGELTKKITLKGFTISQQARKRIEKAGAKIVE